MTLFLAPPRTHILFLFLFFISIFLNLRTKILGTLFGTWFLHIKKKLFFFFTNMLTIFFSQFSVWSFTKMSLDSFCWKWKCQKFFSYYVFILTFFEYWKWKWDNQKQTKKNKKQKKKGKKKKKEMKIEHTIFFNGTKFMLYWNDLLNIPLKQIR